MSDEEKPPNVINETHDVTLIKDESEQTETFPLKNAFEETLERARELRKKYSEEHLSDPAE